MAGQPQGYERVTPVQGQPLGASQQPQPQQFQGGVQTAVASQQGDRKVFWNPYEERGASGQTGKGLLGIADTNMVGGTKGYNDRQDLYFGGVGAGAGMTDYGVGMAGRGANLLGQAASNTQGDRAFGQGVAQGGLGQQNQSLANARAMAARPTDSLAQMQLQQGLAQNQQAMLGQAASARGGNQAAAIQAAQSMGANAALNTNAQAAQLRAAEQQAALNRQIGVEQLASQVGGLQLGQGLGAVQQGNAQLGQAGAQIGGIGGNVASTGVNQQGQYLGAMGLTDKLQSDFMRDHTEAEAARDNKLADQAIGSANILGKVLSFMG